MTAMHYCNRRVIKSFDWSKYDQILLTPQLFDEMHLHSIFRTPSLSTISSTRLTAPPPPKLLHCTSTTTTTLAVSDDELESRGFQLRRTAEGLDLEALNTVFTRVGFPRRDPARVRLALKHTQAVVWLEDQRSGKPVAFARATGDGVFNAVVWDVVVDPSFQGIGLGRAVMERLVADLVADGVSNIALYAEPRVIGFYRPLGFAADPDGIKGMVYVRKKKSG